MCSSCILSPGHQGENQTHRRPGGTEATPPPAPRWSRLEDSRRSMAPPVASRSMAAACGGTCSPTAGRSRATAAAPGCSDSGCGGPAATRTGPPTRRRPPGCRGTPSRRWRSSGAARRRRPGWGTAWDGCTRRAGGPAAGTSRSRRRPAGTSTTGPSRRGRGPARGRRPPPAPPCSWSRRPPPACWGGAGAAGCGQRDGLVTTSLRLWERRLSHGQWTHRQSLQMVTFYSTLKSLRTFDFNQIVLH